MIEHNTRWPSGVNTASGERIDLSSALCDACGDLMEDHTCPTGEQERVRTHKGNGILKLVPPKGE